MTNLLHSGTHRRMAEGSPFDFIEESYVFSFPEPRTA